MTILDITYEDGLRLSELQGQLCGLEYEVSHLIASNLTAIALILLLGVLVGVMLAVGIDGIISNKLSERGQDIIMCLVLFGTPALFVFLAVIGLDASVHIQMAEVQGQIDVILSRYEVGA